MFFLFGKQGPLGQQTPPCSDAAHTEAWRVWVCGGVLGVRTSLCLEPQKKPEVQRTKPKAVCPLVTSAVRFLLKKGASA